MNRGASFERSIALDKVHNLQKSKASFENNSSSISQDLSNQFAQFYIKELGAENFENIIRTDPVKTNQLLECFLNTKVNLHSSSIADEYTTNEASMQSSNIDNDYQKNSKTIENTNIDHHAQIHAETPNDFKNNIQNNIAVQSLKQNEVEQNLNEAAIKVTSNEGNIQSKELDLRNKVEDKTKR